MSILEIWYSIHVSKNKKMKEVYSVPAEKKDIIKGSAIFDESTQIIKSIKRFENFLNGVLVKAQKALKDIEKFTIPSKILKKRGQLQHLITLYEEGLEGIKWHHTQKKAKKAHYIKKINKFKDYIKFIDDYIAKKKVVFKQTIVTRRKQIMRIIKNTESAKARLDSMKNRANLSLEKEEVIIEKLYKIYLHNIENPPRNPDKL